jgi:hypothetical protein
MDAQASRGPAAGHPFATGTGWHGVIRPQSGGVNQVRTTAPRTWGSDPPRPPLSPRPATTSSTLTTDAPVTAANTASPPRSLQRRRNPGRRPRQLAVPSAPSTPSARSQRSGPPPRRRRRQPQPVKLTPPGSRRRRSERVGAGNGVCTGQMPPGRRLNRAPPGRTCRPTRTVTVPRLWPRRDQTSTVDAACYRGG